MAHRDTVQSPKSDHGKTLSRRRFLQGGLATAATAVLALPTAVAKPRPRSRSHARHRRAHKRQRPQHLDHPVRRDALPAVLRVRPHQAIPRRASRLPKHVARRRAELPASLYHVRRLRAVASDAS